MNHFWSRRQTPPESEPRRRGVLRRHPFLSAAALLGLAVLCGPTVYANVSTTDLRYEPTRVGYDAVPERDTALVLGAGLRNDGTEPSAFLYWRVETAVALYKAGKVERLLMSGGRTDAKHDEPRVMQRVAEQMGVPGRAIVQDSLGLDTFDSCERAKRVYGVRSVTVVTQGYHLPRAVMSCRYIGLDVIGVNAHTQFRSWRAGWYVLREWLATDKLVLQVVRDKAAPAMARSRP